MQGFLANLYLRPSCYACAARSGKSGSDISIADFWGVQNYYPEFDDDKGVGLILVNSKKGEVAYGFLDDQKIVATYEQGLKRNPCLEYSVEKPIHYVLFWNVFSTSFMGAMADYDRKVRPSLFYRGWGLFKRKLKKIFKLTLNKTVL